MNDPSSQAPANAEPAASSWLAWVIAVTVIVGLGLVLWLLPHPQLEGGRREQQAEIVVTEAHTLRVPPGTPFAERLRVANVRVERTEQPLLVVTGSVLAAVPADPSATPDWEFANPELVTTYAEWAQSGANVGFSRRQLDNTRKLAATRLRTQGEVVDRLQRLVEVGSDSPRELALERASLLERKLEADGHVHEAQAELYAAERKQAALTNQLEQAGLAPDLLRDTARGRVLLVAEVPETRAGGLHTGQRCSVHLYAAPQDGLTGQIARVLPTLSAAQRTLRVVVLLDHPGESVRPGMFADVGIGTDARMATFVPQTAIVHVGHDEYVLVEARAGARERRDVEAAPNEWRIAVVQLGAERGPDVEVASGVEPGARVLGEGVVLFKPVIANVVHAGSSL